MATDSTLPSGQFPDSDLMNYAVRMVVPMRREFGRALDVSHFLHDFAYAKEVLDQAKASQNERLREYAAHLEANMFGPRNAHVSSRKAVTPSAAPPAPPAAHVPPLAGENGKSSGPTDLSEAELRAKMMAKYRSGLR